jgi:hypothetical protein
MSLEARKQRDLKRIAANNWLRLPMFENVIKVTQFRMDIVDSLYKDR